MKVLHVTESLGSPANGIGTSVLSLVQGQEERGDHALIISGAWDQGRAGKSLVGYDHVSIRSAASVSGFPVTIGGRRQLEGVLGRFNPDVVHIHSPGLLGQTVVRMSEDRALPRVTTWHTDVITYMDSYPHIGIGLPLAFLWGRLSLRRGGGASVALRALAGTLLRRDEEDRCRQLTAGYLARFHVVIAPSQKSRKSLLELGVSDTCIRVIPTAPSDPGAGDRGPDTIRACRQKSDVPTLLAIGRTAKEKGFSLLLDAWGDHVLPTYPSARLLIVGEGAHHSALQREVLRKGLGTNVALTGEVARSGLGELMQECLALVVPSTTETQGLTVFEAALEGLVSVVVDSATLDQVGGVNSGFVSAADAPGLGEMLRYAIDHPEERRDRARRARECAQAYRPRQFANIVNDTYAAAMSSTVALR